MEMAQGCKDALTKRIKQVNNIGHGIVSLSDYAQQALDKRALLDLAQRLREIGEAAENVKYAIDKALRFSQATVYLNELSGDPGE